MFNSAELVKMGDPASRASELMKKADKKLNSFGFFSSSKYDDAAEMYERAANQFKLAKACELSTLFPARISCFPLTSLTCSLAA